MITFALTPHKSAIQEANKICSTNNYKKIRLFVDLRNSIPAFFDEEKVQLLLKDIETSIISFVESTLRFMEYSLINFNVPVEFHFFYEIGRSEYHKKLCKEYKSNRHNSYLILSPDEVKQASELNIKCFDALYETLKNAKHTFVYKIQYFEADFIPYYITKEYPDSESLDIILSNDKDMFQVLTKDKKIIQFKKDFRKKETRVITFDNMYQELTKSDISIDSDHNFVADILAVSGDESDGVKGVKGIGYVTALKLFAQLKLPLENILEINDINKILEQTKVDLKGRLLTALKKILESKDQVELNRKLVDYSIITKYIPLSTYNNIKESYAESYDFNKFFEDIKFIKTDFTTLLSTLFPEYIDIIEREYVSNIINGIYQETSVDRTLKNQLELNKLKSDKQCEIKDAKLFMLL